MTTGNLIKKFFTKSETVNAAAHQREKAKKENRIIMKVEIVDAFKLFKENGWNKKNPFEKLGRPKPGQFMVIVHYNHNVEAVKKTSAIKKNIIKAAKLKDAAKRFRVVRLNKTQVDAAFFNFVSNITVPAFRFRYRTNCLTGKISKKSILFAPMSYRYSIAA